LPGCGAADRASPAGSRVAWREGQEVERRQRKRRKEHANGRKRSFPGKREAPRVLSGTWSLMKRARPRCAPSEGEESEFPKRWSQAVEGGVQKQGRSQGMGEGQSSDGRVGLGCWRVEFFLFWVWGQSSDGGGVRIWWGPVTDGYSESAVHRPVRQESVGKETNFRPKRVTGSSPRRTPRILGLIPF
uniref:Uncharacterized protein n=1 Tax=Scleropages formosus TaxID=113540 RepID=A0A8D0CI48_SCLFO